MGPDQRADRGAGPKGLVQKSPESIRQEIAKERDTTVSAYYVVVVDETLVKQGYKGLKFMLDLSGDVRSTELGVDIRNTQNRVRAERQPRRSALTSRPELISAAVKPTSLGKAVSHFPQDFRYGRASA